MSQASRSFKTNKESTAAGDYIFKKQVEASKCAPRWRNCSYVPTPSALSQYKYNLNMNLFTTLDLSGVYVVEDSVGKVSPTTINKVAAENFYNRYVIDPRGQLFGKTPCGYANFLTFLKENTV
jgi:hypothetical protein